MRLSQKRLALIAFLVILDDLVRNLRLSTFPLGTNSKRAKRLFLPCSQATVLRRFISSSGKPGSSMRKAE
jgi:hypothetical protein